MCAKELLVARGFVCDFDWTFSLDHHYGRKRPQPAGMVYGYPILLMRLLLSWSYLSSALLKLRLTGLSYFSSDNLPSLAILHSLDNLHDTQFRFAFLLPHVREYTPFVLALVVAWELAFPLAVFVKRLRAPVLIGGVLFHVGTLFFMNIFFPYHLAMYLVFIDWERLRERVASVWSTVSRRVFQKRRLSFGEQS